MNAKDALRYAFLRLIGCTPMGSKATYRGEALDKLVDREMAEQSALPDNPLDVFKILIPEGGEVVSVSQGQIHFIHPGIPDQVYVAVPVVRRSMKK